MEMMKRPKKPTRNDLRYTKFLYDYRGGECILIERLMEEVKDFAAQYKIENISEIRLYFPDEYEDCYPLLFYSVSDEDFAEREKEYKKKLKEYNAWKDANADLLLEHNKKLKAIREETKRQQKIASLEKELEILRGKK